MIWGRDRGTVKIVMTKRGTCRLCSFFWFRGLRLDTAQPNLPLPEIRAADVPGFVEFTRKAPPMIRPIGTFGADNAPHSFV